MDEMSDDDDDDKFRTFRESTDDDDDDEGDHEEDEMPRRDIHTTSSSSSSSLYSIFSSIYMLFVDSGKVKRRMSDENMNVMTGGGIFNDNESHHHTI